MMIGWWWDGDGSWWLGVGDLMLVLVLVVVVVVVVVYLVIRCLPLGEYRPHVVLSKVFIARSFKTFWPSDTYMYATFLALILIWRDLNASRPHHGNANSLGSGDTIRHCETGVIIGSDNGLRKKELEFELTWAFPQVTWWVHNPPSSVGMWSSGWEWAATKIIKDENYYAVYT